jgi:hypothetical protein
MTEAVQPDAPAVDEAIRIRNLEKRVAILEAELKNNAAAMEQLVQLVRTSEANRTRNLMHVLSEVFHGVSDQMMAIATVPSAEEYGVQRVEAGTPGTVIVTRKGDDYTFANAEDPDTLINQGTDILVQVFSRKQYLEDGETAWFTLFLNKKGQENGVPPTNSGEDQVSA